MDVAIDRLALGSGENEVVKVQMPGTASELAPSVLGDTLSFYLGGLISHQSFQDQALTFDFDGMRLILH